LDQPKIAGTQLISVLMRGEYKQNRTRIWLDSAMELCMTPKQIRALEVRDLALTIIRRQGATLLDSIMGVTCLSNGLHFSYRTPFQKLPPTPEHVQYMAAQLGQSVEHLPYGLDIWDDASRQKVLNLEWNDAGRAIFTTFKRGEWELRLQQIGYHDA
jgi:hypothetical protein